MGRLEQEMRIAWRGFRRTPSFTLTAILILAIGIGMAVAMFTVYDAVLVRNLPVVAQDRVVELFTYREDPNTDYYMLRGDLRQVAAGSLTMHDVAGIEPAVAAPDRVVRRLEEAGYTAWKSETRDIMLDALCARSVAPLNHRCKQR